MFLQLTEDTNHSELSPEIGLKLEINKYTMFVCVNTHQLSSFNAILLRYPEQRFS